TQLDELVEYANDAGSGNRRRAFDGKAFSAEVVDDIEQPKGAPTRQRVAHEVHRPALVDLRGQRNDGSLRRGGALASSAAHRKSFEAVESINSLMIHAPAFSAQQDVEPPISEAWPRHCQLSQTTTQIGGILAPRLVAERRAHEPN